MLELGVKLLLAYLMGSVVGALVIGRFRGVDIRTMGSGNAGGTNALRTQGLAFAAATVAIDVGKGWLAAGWLPGLDLPGIAVDRAAADSLTVSCGAAAVAGHVWPLWHGFRGGKGGATFLGALLALSPMLLVIALATWLAVAALFGYVGLATVAAVASVPVAAAFAMPRSVPWLAFGLAMTALVAFAHRGNFARMRAGTEPRATKIWLFRGRSGPG
jgi:glycerol-3-phosphate acyltransferase PlsY